MISSSRQEKLVTSIMTQFPKLLLSTWTRLMLKSALTTSRSTTTVQRMQSMLSLLWVLSATVRKKLLITSMPQAKRSVFLKFTFTDLSLPTICSESFLRLLRQSLFLTEQRNPVQSANLFILMFSPLSTVRTLQV